MRSFVPLVAAFTGLCLAGPVKRVDDGPVWDTVDPAPSNTPAVDFTDIFGGPINPKNMTAQEAIKYYSWNKEEPSNCQLRPEIDDLIDPAYYLHSYTDIWVGG
ncbi:hypothetical protein MHUMG1_04536 [Metarhizium humberi]|uniref:Uncharacterized protein n=1 Tax=Metarhizium humberi TaxID=2596975 RepID=A0A9P8MF87_9HYPO|nr:hypothetical protein MHUMG1_04536 [Metarhizium humberi]